jgi:hypothetical protein
MSIELHVFFHIERVPDRDTWQREIERLAFPSVLDPSLKVRVDTGFIPGTFRGRVAGFEFSLTPAIDILSSYPHIEPRIAGRNSCATFRWSGSMDECGSAICAAAALAQIADGVYFYPDDDILLSAEGTVGTTLGDLNAIP